MPRVQPNLRSEGVANLRNEWDAPFPLTALSARHSSPSPSFLTKKLEEARATRRSSPDLPSGLRREAPGSSSLWVAPRGRPRPLPISAHAH